MDVEMPKRYRSRADRWIFMSMSFHHFSDPACAARECRRVLRQDGTLIVRTGTREQIASYPYVPFFPQTRSMIEELLADVAGLRAVFETAGFRCRASDIVTRDHRAELEGVCGETRGWRGFGAGETDRSGACQRSRGRAESRRWNGRPPCRRAHRCSRFSIADFGSPRCAR